MSTQSLGCISRCFCFHSFSKPPSLNNRCYRQIGHFLKCLSLKNADYSLVQSNKNSAITREGRVCSAFTLTIVSLLSAPGTKSISTRAVLVLLSHYMQRVKLLFSHYALTERTTKYKDRLGSKLSEGQTCIQQISWYFVPSTMTCSYSLKLHFTAWSVHKVNGQLQQRADVVRAECCRYGWLPKNTLLKQAA